METQCRVKQEDMLANGGVLCSEAGPSPSLYLHDMPPPNGSHSAECMAVKKLYRASLEIPHALPYFPQLKQSTQSELLLSLTYRTYTVSYLTLLFRSWHMVDPLSIHRSSH